MTMIATRTKGVKDPGTGRGRENENKATMDHFKLWSIPIVTVCTSAHSRIISAERARRNFVRANRNERNNAAFVTIHCELNCEHLKDSV